MERNSVQLLVVLILIGFLSKTDGTKQWLSSSPRAQLQIESIERRLDALSTDNRLFRQDIADIVQTLEERGNANDSYAKNDCIKRSPDTEDSEKSSNPSKSMQSENNVYKNVLHSAFKDEKKAVRDVFNMMKDKDNELFKRLGDVENKIHDELKQCYSIIGHNDDNMRKIKTELEDMRALATEITGQMNSFKKETKVTINRLQEEIRQLKLQNEVTDRNIGNIRNCPNDWFRYKKSCYFFNSELKTWNQSMEWCHVNSAYLVEYDDNSEANTVFSFAKQIKTMYWSDSKWAGFWAGASDTAVEGIWVWETSRANVTNGIRNWRSGQPDNGGEREHCLVTLIHDDGRWNDNPCSRALSFVCERQIL